MIFNSEGLSYATKYHTKTMWTYHRELVLESILSRQRESSFTITAGVKKPNTSLFIYRGQLRQSRTKSSHFLMRIKPLL